MAKKEYSYVEDILGNDFEQCKIELTDDYEGRAECTLIHRLSHSATDKAVLYIHGFNDYFFQAEMAFQYNDHNCNFYALDLRKYGRSFLPHQKFNDIRNLKDYYEEINLALDIIHYEGNKTVSLMGHSTGGLLITLFAKDNTRSKMFDGIILNSPFYEFNQSWLAKKLIPIASWLGKYFPTIRISGGFAKEYGEYLHKDFFGEWDYNLDWKPNIAPQVNLGWIRAIYQGQKELKRKFTILQPCLVLHSEHSTTDMNDPKLIQSSDTILNIEDIKRIAHNIGGNVEIVPIDGGLHDLILSEKDVRKNVYDIIWGWMTRNQLI